jgi:hypothetical protein
MSTINTEQINIRRASFIPAGAKPIETGIALAAAYQYEHRGQISALGFYGRAEKPTFHYKFRDSAQLANYLKRWTERIAQIESGKAQRRAEAKSKRAEPLQLALNDVLYCSWGYEQTNVDYYQITKIITNHTIEVRKIRGQMTERGGSCSMSGYSRPVLDAFCGEPMQKRVLEDRQSIRISSHTWARKLDSKMVGGVRVFDENYCSWYA